MKFIVAFDLNYGIGKDGDLLLKIPEDMKFFKEKTIGNIVVMGRKTYNTLPYKKPLKDRHNIILTRDPLFEADGFTIYNDIQKVFELEKLNSKEDIYIIGGSEIYRYFLKYCDMGYATRIINKYNADKFFENIDKLPNWKKNREILKNKYNNVEYIIEEYKNNMIIKYK